MQKRRNDVKTFGRNEATKKTKKNQLKQQYGNFKTKKKQLKQQYGNFKTEGTEILEQTFNRLHAIKFRIQQYLQNEHYALWEVIEFSDSYKDPQEEAGKDAASESSAKKKGRTVVITTEDMQKRRNDIKARTTLLLALPDEHQLRFSNLAPEWLMYTIVWRNRDDLDTMSLANTSNGKGEVHTASVLTASTQVSTTSADVAAASISHDTVCAYIASQSNNSQIKYEDITLIDEDDIEEMDISETWLY
nr:hypothetical protein [Tanacetum cinerariifolium]